LSSVNLDCRGKCSSTDDLMEESVHQMEVEDFGSVHLTRLSKKTICYIPLRTIYFSNKDSASAFVREKFTFPTYTDPELSFEIFDRSQEGRALTRYRLCRIDMNFERDGSSDGLIQLGMIDCSRMLFDLWLWLYLLNVPKEILYNFAQYLS